MKKYILPKKFEKKMLLGGETGMGWAVIRVTLKSGKIYKNVLVVGNVIDQAYGHKLIPFEIDDIKNIEVTHERDYPKEFWLSKTRGDKKRKSMWR